LSTTQIDVCFNATRQVRHSIASGADQTLALGKRPFSKPAGRDQAAEQLRSLAGNSHELHSAVSVARDGKILFADVSVARMTMGGWARLCRSPSLRGHMRLHVPGSLAFVWLDPELPHVAKGIAAKPARARCGA
jgi:hypothetical protein